MRKLLAPIGLCNLVLAAGVVAALASQGQRTNSKPQPRTEPIRFNRDIRPILAEKCWTCHGADAAAREKTGGVRLDTFDDATASRNGRRSIVPGKPEQSILWARVSTDIPELRMPPNVPGHSPLTKAELAAIERWIREGATFEGHWAFTPPKMPAIPEVAGNPAWKHNPIDAFVWKELAEAKIAPSNEADRETLIRRVALTLTGIPPTPIEIDRFLADSKAGAYERMVDRFLASPRYGEHQARYWLDAVRYGDTHGLHIDNERAIYPWRDWLVRALNDDLAFDQFTKWQLAGDLLPKPTVDQLIATGYIRMNPTTNEGGVIEEEFLVKNTFDRVDTTATVFLGLTAACAKCHDHKYDPISQKEYYGLFAFFNSTADAPLDGNLRLHAPFMKAPSPEQTQALEGAERKLREIESKVDFQEMSAWLSTNSVELPSIGRWEVSQVFPAKSFDEAFETTFGPELDRPATPIEWKLAAIKPENGQEGLIRRDNAAIYVRTTLTAKSAGPAPLTLGSDDGVIMWLNGTEVHRNKVLRGLQIRETDDIELDLRAGENFVLIKIVNAAGGDGLRFKLGDDNLQRLSTARDLVSRAKRTAMEESAMRSAYLELGPESELAKEYRKARGEYQRIEASIPQTLIAQELKMPRPAYVLHRGEYDQRGKPVFRGIPSIFGKWSETWPRNRLGLAQWLTSRSNPLTSRVIVNRIWQQHFGLGLVRTSEDFGVRGEPPSHPELLDYLAVKFMDDKWSLKALHRRILTSATFKQSAVASQTLWKRDPENRLLARGPRYRLDGEVIRDLALFASGLLVEKPGGRGDRPYQPPGLWEIISFNSSDTSKYIQDTGEGLYRRSIYMFWKRTSPPVTLMTFDAPMRESCVVRRSRTNTPLQALATMNDPQFFEAARAFAERLIKNYDSDDARIAAGFRIATGRRPSSEELGVLRKLLASQRIHFANDLEGAESVLKVGDSKRDTSIPAPEHAAMAIVCSTLLNLDETITQH